MIFRHKVVAPGIQLNLVESNFGIKKRDKHADKIQNDVFLAFINITGVNIIC